MTLHRVRRGLDLPILGTPGRELDNAPTPGRVALIATDYPGMKPTMHVEVGDAVARGQLLFADKKTEGVRFTAPAAGRVTRIERGAKRSLRSVVLQVDAQAPDADTSFSAFTGKHPTSASADEVRELLLESGEWTALRSRPFARVAKPGERPHSIFVTAWDSNALAPDLEVAVAGHEDAFERGLTALAKLTEGPVFVCCKAGSKIPVPERQPFRREEFAGPHPSGTAGLHIHELDPVDRNKTVWYVGLQDVVAIGYLFERGRVWSERVVTIGGPGARNPRHLRTRVGASTDDICRHELGEGELRIVSGPVLSGRAASGEIDGYLGRYDQQISVLHEDHERHFLGWLRPGFDKFSTTFAFLSSLLPKRRFDLSTAVNGSPRAIVPIGLYERVTPFDLPISFLLKAIVVDDIERAEELGVLELGEEDLGLCTFVCPGKIDYGPHLRHVLTTIEKEG